ncbi:Epidermal growth factor receptor kinase substrate 8 [Nymphon striatum]|nr:Epidermal growth factor receptor kinase substrate 8 [Nymphon striatum]
MDGIAKFDSNWVDRADDKEDWRSRREAFAQQWAYVLHMHYERSLMILVLDFEAQRYYQFYQQSDSNDDLPSFLIEHLATFTVSSSTGIHSPADGMRRLLQLEKQGGIWVQKMELRFDKKSVFITDLESGDLVEKFPRECFCDPTAFTSSDPKELYANIFVFVVNREPGKKHSDNAEMHIFKCTDMSALDIVDDVKMILNGKWQSGVRRDRHQIPPPPIDPAPEPPGGAQSRINVREQVSRFDAVAAATNSNDSAEAHSPTRPQLISPQQHSGSGNRSEIRSEIRSSYNREANEDSESNYSEKYERNIAVLNHCFDDIERFIARLHHAAAAYMELEKRKKSRKNKKKDIGDGMLSMRAKPPPEKEFLDTFQKFKLSFNLLMLPEMQIMGQIFQVKLCQPLLTRDTHDLFSNCLTSKESELWHSLGECWLIPKEQWKVYVQPYRPVFMDGWSPDLSLLDDKERSEIATSNRNGIREQEYHASKDETDFYYSDRVERGSPGPLPPPPHHEAPRPSQAYENQQYESRHMMERQHDDRKNMYREKIRTPPLERGDFIGERDYKSRMDMEYRQGERIERDYPDPDYRDFRHERDYRPEIERDFRGPMERDNRDRIEVRSDFSADSIERGPSPGPGPIPVESSVQFERQQKQWVDDLRIRNCKIVQVKYPRTANNNKELTVVRGEFLEVLDDKRKWWKVRNCHTMIGHLPHTIVAEVHGTEDDIFNNPLYSSRGGIPPRDPYYGMNDSPRDRSDDSNFGSHLPDGNHQGVVARSPVRASADWIRKERQGKKGEFRYF